MNDIKKKGAWRKRYSYFSDPDDKAQAEIETEADDQGEKRGFVTILTPFITMAVAMITLAVVAWWGLNKILPQFALTKHPTTEIASEPINKDAKDAELNGIGKSVEESAQNGGKITSEMVAYLTISLKLTAEEAGNFWPVYNDYSSRRDKLNQDKNSLLEQVTRNFENLTREELTETGDRVIEMGNQEASLAAEYHIRFGKVLPPEKVILLYGAEAQFKTLSLDQLQ